MVSDEMSGLGSGERKPPRQRREQISQRQIALKTSIVRDIYGKFSHRKLWGVTGERATRGGRSVKVSRKE
jgi:hypothetical protein